MELLVIAIIVIAFLYVIRPTRRSRSQDTAAATRPTPSRPQRSDVVILESLYTAASREGLVAGWAAAAERTQQLTDRLSTRIITHFFVAIAVAAPAIVLADGRLTPQQGWIPDLGGSWYVVAVAALMIYFILALQIILPRRVNLDPVPSDVADHEVRRLVTTYFLPREHTYKDALERVYAESQRLAVAAATLEATRAGREQGVREARAGALEEGRQQGREQARAEFAAELEAATRSAFEHGRQTGEADRGHAIDQAFERGFLKATAS
jgi:hypothetical protein